MLLMNLVEFTNNLIIQWIYAFKYYQFSYKYGFNCISQVLVCWAFVFTPLKLHSTQA